MLDENQQIKEIYDKYSTSLYNICFSVLKDKYLAADALSEVFIKLYKNLTKFNKHPNQSAYIYRIAKNTAIDFYRKEKKRRDNITEYIDFNKPANETAEDVFLKNRINSVLIKGIKNLNPREQKAICLYYMEEKALCDIAKTLGISYNTVKMMLLRARKKLKAYIDEEVG